MAATLALAAAAPLHAAEGDRFIIVASTTSTANSGLFEYLLPKFESKTGIDIRVVPVGTGAALDMGRRCDADVVLVHAKKAEQRFVAEGYGVERFPVMYNDFVIVGPASDPAGVGGMKSAAKALEKIRVAEAVFLSRGDDSGTHKREMQLWQAAGIDPGPDSGTWYRETGSGMGATLNTARAMGGYTLTDRGTWLSFENKGDMEILVQGGGRLFNPYGVIMVNPERCPSVKVEAAQAFMDWLRSDRGQKLIGAYRLNGQQLFHPNADGRIAGNSG